MVTPSFVINGEPNAFSNTTLRPLGPKVTFTVFAKISTPRSIAALASSENLISFTIFQFLAFLLDNCNNILFFYNNIFLTI